MARHPTTVLLTGASSGLGRATAACLIARGAHVFAGVHDTDAARTLHRALPAVEPLVLDLSRPHTLAATASYLEAALGPRGLDVVVHGAAIAHGGPLEVLPPEQLEHVFHLNVFGSLRLTRAVLPLLRAAQGRVLFLTAVSPLGAMPLHGAYGAANAALRSLTTTLRGELAPQGITVLEVCTGPVATPIWSTAQHEALALLDHLTFAQRARYSDLIHGSLRMLRRTDREALPAPAAGRAIAAVALAPRPSPRTTVGLRAFLSLLAQRLLPEGLTTWLRQRRRRISCQSPPLEQPARPHPP